HPRAQGCGTGRTDRIRCLPSLSRHAPTHDGRRRRLADGIRPVAPPRDRVTLARRRPRRGTVVRLSAVGQRPASNQLSEVSTVTAVSSRLASQSLRIGIVTAALLLGVYAIAMAHAVVYPKASTTGAHERYVIRVPNERAVATTRVEIQFPPE